MSTDWIMLIYSLPSQPSRKRAYVWRELKRLGAAYLRDGVALLPRRDEAERRLLEIARRIEQDDGTVEVVLSPTFYEDDDQRFIERFQADRTEEYRELYRECVHFLRDVLEEVDAQDFAFPDVDKLESSLGRLQRWREQIAERDYFGAPGSDRVVDALQKCAKAFESFVSDAAARQHAQNGEEPDGVSDTMKDAGASGSTLR